VQRLVRIEKPRRQQISARVGLAYGLREHVDPVGRIRKSEPRGRNAEPGPARRDTNVACERDLHSTPDTHPGNHRDDRLVAFDQRRDSATRRLAIRTRLLRIGAQSRKLRDIRAGYECLRRDAAHDDHANRVVARKFRDSLRDTLPGPKIQRISELAADSAQPSEWRLVTNNHTIDRGFFLTRYLLQLSAINSFCSFSSPRVSPSAVEPPGGAITTRVIPISSKGLQLVQSRTTHARELNLLRIAPLLSQLRNSSSR